MAARALDIFASGDCLIIVIDLAKSEIWL
jgi:hypothetical protein